ncbi:hypothetical protein Tco_1203470 [Tanacetum coccineum]
MASFDYRLNPLYTIKECSSCRALYTTDYCCSKGGLVDKIIRDPNKIPDSSQRTPQNCARCENSIDGPYCRGCALLRKKFKEDLFTYCVESKIFQDLQDTFESSNDNTNVVNAPQEPFVVKQDLGENSSQSPPHIDHHCCYECGDSLDDIFCQRCTYRRIAEDQAAKDRYWKIPICYDDDEDYTIAITPVLSTEEPVDSLIMEDEHLDAIPATESDEVIKSSVENLVPIPSESEGIPDKMCDVPLCNNPTPLEAFKEHSEIVVDFNDDSTSSDDDSPYGEDIDYVDASPPDAEIVSLEEVEIVVPKVGEIEDDILREKLSKINLLIAKIEAINSNPPLSSGFIADI